MTMPTPVAAPVDHQRYRQLAPGQLELRKASQGGDGRTLYGIAVPWGVETSVWDWDGEYIEEFQSGAFAHQERAANRVWFAREHMGLGGTLIGKMTMMRNDAAGLYTELRASNTPAGNEALELYVDGALDELSIGFRDRAGGTRAVDGNKIIRVAADLIEVALVLEGAYGRNAVATGSRSQQGQTPTSPTDPPATSTGRPLTNMERARIIVGGIPPLPPVPAP